MAITLQQIRMQLGLDWARELALDALRTPAAVLWPGDRHLLREELRTLEELLPGCPLPRRSLFVSLLLRPCSNRPCPSPYAADDLPQTLLEDLPRWRWQAVAVPVVVENKGSLIWFMVAAGQRAEALPSVYPPSLAKVLRQESRQAIEDAFVAARRQLPGYQFYTFALLDDGSPVEGRSLGLPLGLAALAAAAGGSSGTTWLATGDLQENGVIRSVLDQDLSCKGAEAAKRFSLFLYPADNRPLPTTPRCHGKAVADLAQAWLWANRYTAESPQEVQTLELALGSAEALVANCADLSGPSLDYYRQTQFSTHKVQIIADRKMLADLSRKLDGLTGIDHGKAEALAAFFDEEDLAVVGRTSPLVAFTWCSCRLGLVNHSGDNTAALHWKAIAERYKEGARSQSPDEFSKFINRFYVSCRHNCYRFDPDISSEFMDVLVEEERYHRGGVNDVLGSMYGTLAQNYGFCGPAYLEELKAYVAKAQGCFGNGELKDEARRGFSYLFCGFLDAADYTAARAALWAYIDAEGWRQQPAALGGLRKTDRPFAEAMLVRYLAETFDPAAAEAEVGGLVEHLLAAGPPNGDGHPWQLYACNAGNLAWKCGRPALAEAFWERSLALCDPRQSRKAGETMQVMGLLPLVALAGQQRLDERHLMAAADILQIIRNSSFLCQQHFACLDAAVDGESALRLARANLPALFPFSYR